MNAYYVLLVALISVISTAHGVVRPFLNCTRYLEPCVSRQGDCCGYPFFDCLSDGRQHLCQDIQDFPELGAELLLRLRGAKDRGDPAAKEIHEDVNGLLDPLKKKSAKGGDNKKKGKSNGGGGKKGGKNGKKDGKKGGKKGGKDGKKTKKQNKKESKKSMKKETKSKKKKTSETRDDD